MPFWAVCVAVVVSLLSFTVLAVPFWAMSKEQATGALDPAARTCGSKLGLVTRSIPWVLVALGMSSALSAVHPLQSGMIMGF